MEEKHNKSKIFTSTNLKDMNYNERNDLRNLIEPFRRNNNDNQTNKIINNDIKMVKKYDKEEILKLDGGNCSNNNSASKDRRFLSHSLLYKSTKLNDNNFQNINNNNNINKLNNTKNFSNKNSNSLNDGKIITTIKVKETQLDDSFTNYDTVNNNKLQTNKDNQSCGKNQGKSQQNIEEKFNQQHQQHTPLQIQQPQILQSHTQQDKIINPLHFYQQYYNFNNEKM